MRLRRAGAVVRYERAGVDLLVDLLVLGGTEVELARVEVRPGSDGGRLGVDVREVRLVQQLVEDVPFSACRPT
jgi:hypothetical protein